MQNSADVAREFFSVLKNRRCYTGFLDSMHDEANNHIQQVLMQMYSFKQLPTQGMVQRRLREVKCPEPIVHSLLPFCAKNEHLYRIEPPIAQSQPIIYLVEVPSWFTGFANPDSGDDCFSPEVWKALETLTSNDDFLLPLPDVAALLPTWRQVPEISNLKFIEIKHLLTLALGRGLLAYAKDGMRPKRIVDAQLEAFRHMSGPFVVPEAIHLQAGVGQGKQLRQAHHEAESDVDPLAAILRLMQSNPNGVRMTQIHGFATSLKASGAKEPFMSSEAGMRLWKEEPGPVTPDKMTSRGGIGRKTHGDVRSKLSKGKSTKPH